MKKSIWIIVLIAIIGILGFVVWQSNITITSEDFTYIIAFIIIIVIVYLIFLWWKKNRKKKSTFFQTLDKIEKIWEERYHSKLYVDDVLSKGYSCFYEELNKKFLAFQVRDHNKKDLIVYWDAVEEDIAGFNYDLGPEHKENPFFNFDPIKTKYRTPITKEKETIYEDKENLKDEDMDKEREE